MFKNYWNHEIARWNKHPYIWTALTAISVGWLVGEYYVFIREDRKEQKALAELKQFYIQNT